MLKKIALPVVAALPFVFVACTVEVPPAPEMIAQPVVAVKAAMPRSMMPMHHAEALRGEAPLRVTAGPLAYYGGRVISNVKVYAVNWGPNVNAEVKAGIGAFYQAVTNSAYFDWLSEYDTVGKNGVDGQAGSNQRVGRGSFGGSYEIVPTTPSTTISDSDVQSELAKQIAAGKLPQPDVDAAGNVNALYMFDFPPDVSITGPTGHRSCIDFCAYHGTAVINGKSVPYGIQPDFTGGCATGCGNDALMFNNATSVHSHELVEAVTDMEVGIGGSVDRPLAWYSTSGGEIGDICNAQQGLISGYVVQKQYSNSKNGCIVATVQLICDGTGVNCRPCTAADNGQPSGCTGAHPICETDAANAKHGQCVQCTSDARCSGTAPLCNRANDSCGECKTNANCSGATPICDGSSNRCRRCKTTADCASGVCATDANDPKVGTCVQCTTTADCTAPSVCDTTKDTCVQCTDNSSCANPKPVCGTNESCRDCATDAECAGSVLGNACTTTGPLKGSCTFCSATRTAACPAEAPACNNDTGKCVECSEDVDCRSADKPACDKSAHTCGARPVTPDAGVADAGQTPAPDAGIAGNDGGGPPVSAAPSNSSGCAMTPSTSNAGAGALLALGLVAALGRRRAASAKK